MDENSAKIMYELSKLTNKPRQITNDFIETITLVMFRELISAMPNKEAFVDLVLDNWEQQIIAQKRSELELLTSKQSTLFELAAGAIIANSENIDGFIEEVRLIKNLYKNSLLSTNW